MVIRTPKGNLSYGMRWLQSTWANRFNRYRKVQGQLFQGRFKSLIVDEGEYLGSLLHYVHLNPVRAGMCTVQKLKDYRWSSYWYLWNKKQRPDCLRCEEALSVAGGLSDNKHGYRKYAEYLEWLATDDVAQKNARFHSMNRGWAIGSKAFKQETLEAFGLDRLAAGQERLPYYEGGDIQSANRLLWENILLKSLMHLGKNKDSIANEPKSVDWKVMIAAAMKRKNSATNIWLSEHLNMGVSTGVARYVKQFVTSGGERKVKYKQLIAGIMEWHLLKPLMHLFKPLKKEILILFISLLIQQ